MGKGKSIDRFELIRNMEKAKREIDSLVSKQVFRATSRGLVSKAASKFEPVTEVRYVRTFWDWSREEKRAKPRNWCKGRSRAASRRRARRQTVVAVAIV